MFSFRLLLLLAIAVSAGAQAPAGIRVLPGATETESTSWGPAVPITDPGMDVYRTAVAIDGKHGTWVFGSQNTRDNFESFARSVAAGQPGPVIQISKDPGSDIDPVAATDSKGNVWVAWQGWRNVHGQVRVAIACRALVLRRPALVSRAAGSVMIIGASDGRAAVLRSEMLNHG